MPSTFENAGHECNTRIFNISLLDNIVLLFLVAMLIVQHYFYFYLN